MKQSTLIVLSLAALGLSGCGGGHAPEKAAEAVGPVRVQAVEARQVDWESTYDAPGTVRARVVSTIASKVMGFVREVRVQPGDTVRAGQMLVIIDSRDLEAGLAQARAAEQEARSAVSETENGIAAAKAQLGLAQVTFRRMEDLFAKKSVSNQEFDEAQARLRTAEAGFQMALSKRGQLEARIAQAKQGVEASSVMRSYGEISAPFAGIVTEKKVEQGQMATPGTPLLTIEQLGSYRLEAPVEESMIGRLRRGQSVPVALDALARTVDGRVDEIVPAVDPVSRAFVVKVAIPNVEGLRSGLFGRLRLLRGKHQAVVVPAVALATRGELRLVFVVENGVARSRMVTTGGEQSSQVEVLSGLHAGDRVLSPLPANVTDGMRVEVHQ